MRKVGGARGQVKRRRGQVEDAGRGARGIESVGTRWMREGKVSAAQIAKTSNLQSQRDSWEPVRSPTDQQIDIFCQLNVYVITIETIFDTVCNPSLVRVPFVLRRRRGARCAVITAGSRAVNYTSSFLLTTTTTSTLPWRAAASRIPLSTTK